jgi:ubiquinone/menaquinone biosynthesis C-methylase UbiE
MHSGREVYTHDYADEHTRLHGSRTAAQDGAFFLPLLRPGFRLLDCGCGPGSITVGLAQVVAPGEVVAIDIAPVQLETARAAADQRGVGNIEFRVADVYELPFAAGSFDAVFAHNVLEHLREPVTALKEMWRVLRPGGVVGIRDDDWTGYLLEPMSPLKKLGIELILRVVEHNGGSFRSARFHARRLREAGFVGVQDHASAYGNGTRESAAELAPVMARQVEDADFVSIVEREQWADRATLHDIAAEFRTWGESPDCYLACFKCAATGRRPD